MLKGIIGMSLGAILAVCISWTKNHSILWAIIHGILGWFYVVYYVLIKI
jgi:positive regulator of sigma E activity